MEVAGYAYPTHIPGHDSEDCIACRAFAPILWIYGSDINRFGERCTTLSDQTNDRRIFCATYSRIRGVGLNEVATADEAAIALPSQAFPDKSLKTPEPKKDTSMTTKGSE